MAKIRSPIKFSEHFGLAESTLDALGVLDPTLNVDVKLFIDPLLVGESAHPELRNGQKSFRLFFENIIKLLAASSREGDVPWREAMRRLKFREIPGTCLGYSAATIRGSAFGPELTHRIISTAKEIVDLGVTDPDLFVALPLLEEGVGPDLISDMTTNIILADILEFNQRVLRGLDVPIRRFEFGALSALLPENPTQSRPLPVLLLPMDILRELPIAHDWDSICAAASRNAVLRTKINQLIAAIWEAKTRRQKSAVRKTVLSSREAFETLLDSIHAVDPRAYDFERDPDGLLTWRKLLTSAASEYPLALLLSAGAKPDDVYTVVMRIVEQFRFLVEEKGLWKELWHDSKRRPEKSVQRLFFAVAHSYCEANNLDLSPEMDTGSGQVDFKFSLGAKARVIVEIKLSDNARLFQGYETQLETYKRAEETSWGIYVIVDVGKMGKKDQEILKLKNQRVSRGESASEVVIVNGQVRPSASKQ